MPGNPDLLLPTGAPATLADVRAWLRARGFAAHGKLLRGWERDGDFEWYRLRTMRGGVVGAYFWLPDDGAWGWKGSGFGYRTASREEDARRCAEEAAGKMGWRWP